MTRHLLTRWQTYALVAVIALIVVDVASQLTSFPVRLGMLRVALLFAENIWTNVRMLR